MRHIFIGLIFFFNLSGCSNIPINYHDKRIIENGIKNNPSSLRIDGYYINEHPQNLNVLIFCKKNKVRIITRELGDDFKNSMFYDSRIDTNLIPEEIFKNHYNEFLDYSSKAGWGEYYLKNNEIYGYIYIENVGVGILFTTSKYVRFEMIANSNNSITYKENKYLFRQSNLQCDK